MSVYVDIHCQSDPKASLVKVSLPFPPSIGLVIPLYEQGTFKGGDTVNDEGEEAPHALIGVFTVTHIEVGLTRYGPRFGRGNEAYGYGTPLVHVERVVSLKKTAADYGEEMWALVVQGEEASEAERALLFHQYKGLNAELLALPHAATSVEQAIKRIRELTGGPIPTTWVNSFTDAKRTT